MSLSVLMSTGWSSFLHVGHGLISSYCRGLKNRGTYRPLDEVYHISGALTRALVTKARTCLFLALEMFLRDLECAHWNVRSQ